VAHSSWEEAKKNWDALMADPDFQEEIKSEQANKLVKKYRPNVHAADGFFADEVVPDWARLYSSRQSSSIDI